MPRSISTNVRGAILRNEDRGEIPENRVIRFYFDDHNHIDVSFDDRASYGIQVRGNSAMTISPSVSNDIVVAIRHPEHAFDIEAPKE